MGSARRLAKPLLIEGDRERPDQKPAAKRWRIWEAGVLTYMRDA